MLSVQNQIAVQSRKILRICRLRLFFAVMVRWGLILSAVSSVAVLVLRFLRLCPHLTLLLLAGGPFFAALTIALCAVRKMTLSSSDIGAVLDRESRAGGLLMTSLESGGIGDWTSHLEHCSSASVRIDCRRDFLFLVFAVLFFFGCAVVPVPDFISSSRRTLQIAPQTAALNAGIEELFDAGVIDRERQETMREMLKELERNTDASSPSRVFDTLDSVLAALSDLADNGARNLMSASSQMDDLQQNIQKLEAAPDSALNARIRKAAEQLTSMLNSSSVPACSSTQGGLELSRALQSFLNSPPPVDPEAVKRLAEALKACSSSASKSMKRLAAGSGLSDGRKSELAAFLKKTQLQAATQPGSSSDHQLTAEQMGDLRAAQQAAGCSGSNGQEGRGIGKGGVSRGRGDADMIYAPSDSLIAERGPLYKLSSGSLNPEFGALIGISFAAPDSSAATDDGAGGALKTSVGQGGEARSLRLSPADRGTVSRYFSNSVPSAE